MLEGKEWTANGFFSKGALYLVQPADASWLFV